MLKRIALLVALLALPANAHADVLQKCFPLLSVNGGTSSQTGLVTKLPPFKASTMTVRFTAANTGGTTPTLDLKMQSCWDNTTTYCADLQAADQCTTSPCYFSGTRAFEQFDLNKQTVNWWPYARAVSTMTGTTPTYNYTVEACWPD